MKNISQSALFPLLVMACIATFVSVAYGQKALPSADTSIPTLMQQMVGTWNVEQRMWPGSGADAISLPPALAHRRLIGGAFLEETMELPPGSIGDPFTRVAIFDYNAVNQQYEYFSIDTRAPQMMNERSYEIQGKGAITLYGAALWRRNGEMPGMRHSSIASRSEKSKTTVNWCDSI